VIDSVVESGPRDRTTAVAGVVGTEPPILSLGTQLRRFSGSGDNEHVVFRGFCAGPCDGETAGPARMCGSEIHDRSDAYVGLAIGRSVAFVA
jgi:hypothetical protein